jgi:hypothetical protein
LEGLLTIVITALPFIFLADFPEDAKFLKEEERQYAVARINHDIGRAPSNKVNLKAVLNVFKDWRVWCMCIPGSSQS